MSRLFIITALIAAAAGPAFGAEDRYGPPRAMAGSSALSGGEDRPEPLAPWAKRLAPPPVAQPKAPPTPEPLAPWAKQLSGRQPAPAPVAVNRLPPPTDRPQAFAARPVVQPAAPSMAPQPFAAPAPTPVARVAPVAPPPPMQMAARAPSPTVAAPGASAGPRFYSVARQYGGQPDPIPVVAPARGEALSLAETPQTPQLSRTNAPMDDVPISDTKENAAAARAARLGL